MTPGVLPLARLAGHAGNSGHADDTRATAPARPYPPHAVAPRPGTGGRPGAPIGDARRAARQPGEPARPYNAYFDPLAFETDGLDLPIEGRLPGELAGTLYRNGPNPQFPGAAAHWSLGDGMIHAFRLEGGRASCRNRWIRTARFENERAVGRALKGTYGFDQDDGTANTHVIGHAGRLLALEEAHAPIAIDARSLATLGPLNFEGRYGAAFCAHPKIDPASGELLFFGSNQPGQLSTGVSFGALDAAGQLRKIGHFNAPFASLIHDFAITEHYVLFPVLPLIPGPRPVEAGATGHVWSPALGSRIGVLRRGASAASIRWFEGDACFAFHVMNAFESKGADGRLRLAVDVMRYDEPPLFPHADGRPTDPMRSQARLSRWILDPTATNRRFFQTALDEQSGEFPRIDERQTGRPYRHGWIATSQRVDARPDAVVSGSGFGSGSLSGAGAGERVEGVVHYDHRLGKRSEFSLPVGDRISEPVFAARPGGLEEGDGWLLAVAYRQREDRSDLLVLDARAVDDGPIATIHLPHRVPAGFHGSWIARS